MLAQLDELDTGLSNALAALTDNTGTYPADFQDTVDSALALLQKTQNSLEEESDQEMLDALQGSLDDLQALNTEIDAYAAKLASMAAGVKKASDAVGAVVSVLTAVVSTGII